MGTYKTVGGIAAASAIFMTSSAAFADVSANDVWADWQDYMTGFGYSVEATETATSNGLTVSDLQMTVPIPEEDMTVSVAMSEMTFSDNGDGTVSISIPPVMPVVLNVADSSGQGAEITLDYKTSGFSMIVSGNSNDMNYAYAAASVGVSLATVVVEGQSIDLGTAGMEMSNVSGTSQMTTGNIRTVTQEIVSGAVSYAVDISDPSGSDGKFVLNGGTDSATISSMLAMPNEMDLNDMAAAVQAGFAIDAGYEFGPGSMNFTFQEHGDVVQGSTKSNGSEFGVGIDADTVGYGAHTTDLEINFVGGDVPFPVALKMAELGFEMLIPVSKSDEVQDFSLGFVLADFELPDMIWGMVDPSGQLPRDPATIVLDLVGTGKMFFDLLDENQMAAVEGGEMMPGEINTLILNNLVVSAAGATLTGAGDFEFDNNDLQSFDGVPKPIGAIELNLEGGNGLLDKLVAMGLIPEDDAMGARMMMGMFAVPGDGDDALTSTIEFTEDGHVLANGQRLK